LPKPYLFVMKKPHRENMIEGEPVLTSSQQLSELGNIALVNDNRTLIVQNKRRTVPDAEPLDEVWTIFDVAKFVTETEGGQLLFHIDAVTGLAG
jgi:hypothetical protein